VVGREEIILPGFCRLQIEFGNVRFDQIRKKQMREGRQLPGFRFFLIKDEVNDFAQIGISVLVILPQLLFQPRQGDRDNVGENCGRIVCFSVLCRFIFDWSSIKLAKIDL